LLNFAAEYYHKIRDNNYTHTADSTPNLPGALLVYPAFLTAQGYTTDDVNFRTSWRPRNNLSLVGRYDFQYTAFDSQAAGLAQVQAAQMTSHILSGTATWSPLNRLYLLAGLNYVWDRTDSPAVATTPALQDAKNDYWTANAGLGYALDDKTDFDAQYLYYRAHNFVDNSAYGLPYGAGDSNQGVTAALSRQINRRLRVTLRYGYYVNRDQTSGDHLDYTAHVIYSSLQYRF
jgi:opacity protein-like surface antigen